MNAKGAIALMLLIIGGAFAWHVSFRDEAIERVKKIPSIEVVNRAVPVSVRIHPVTNRVEVGLAIVFAADPKNLISKLGSAMGAPVASDLWPEEIERRLRALAWEHWDVYALVVPYRAVIVEKK